MFASVNFLLQFISFIIQDEIETLKNASTNRYEVYNVTKKKYVEDFSR